MLLPCTGAHTGAPLQGNRHARYLRRVEACLDRYSQSTPATPSKYQTRLPPVGAGHAPPVLAIMICNPIKIQNAFVPPVGADRCVGPLHTCCFRARAHTQVRPYKVGMGSLADHSSEPGGPPLTGGLMCSLNLRHALPRSGPAAGPAQLMRRALSTSSRVGRPSST